MNAKVKPTGKSRREIREAERRRGLDRFIVELKDEAGNVVAQTPDNGDPLPLPADVSGLRVIVKASKRILGGPPLPDPV